MSADHEEGFIRRAIDLSRISLNMPAGGPFGAVIVKDGRIIAEGSNEVTLHNDPTAHAEITAIRKACQTLNTFSLQGCEIYTSCEPCPMCLSALYWAKIDRIHYAASRADAESIGFKDAFIYRELEKPAAQRTIPMIRHYHDEAAGILRNWKAREAKIMY